MARCKGMLLDKTLLIFLFGILGWFCPLSCWCLKLSFLNLRGMQATQISTLLDYGVNLTADLAIDGDIGTSTGGSGCSHSLYEPHPWWKVDLGTNHCLGRITLVNRGDCCNERLSGAIVRAGIETNIFNNAACGSPVTSDQASIPGAHIPISCNPPVIARYVSVDDKDISLTLCEVVVEEYPMEDCLQITILNLRGMQATQISTLLDYGVNLTADLAIDGDLGTSTGDSGCSHSLYEPHPWWKVDLGTNHCLGRITLVNRGDCCNERLSGAIVRVGIEINIFNNAACGSPVTSDQASIPGAHIPISCNPPVIARYVSVDDKDISLTLCEVVVEEYPMEDCLQITILNLRGMQATQISTLLDYGVNLTADLAIDGDLGTSTGDSGCSHSMYEPHPWWKVDLGTNHCLGRITLVNRGDCCNERLSGAIVRAGIETNIFNNAACGSPVTSDQASVPGAHIPISCNPPVFARYVSVDDEDISLTLCEVVVEEYPMEDCLQITTTMTMDTPFAIADMTSSLLFKGKCILNPRPLSVLHMKSLLRCFQRCLRMINECLSFDYVKTSGQCRLYDVKAGDLKADDQPGCMVYAVVRG